MNESTMKSCQTNRIEYIDIAKGILIILVVVGHVTNVAHLMIHGIKAVITAFHMPAFFRDYWTANRSGKYSMCINKNILIQKDITLIGSLCVL